MAISITPDSGYALVGGTTSSPLSLTLGGGAAGETFTPLTSESYSVTVSGGTGPYTYQWILLNPYGESVAASLMSAPTGSSGTYTNSRYWAAGIWVEAVTVTDSTGAVARAWRQLIQPGSLGTIFVTPPISDYFILDANSSTPLDVVSNGVIGGP